MHYSNYMYRRILPYTRTVHRLKIEFGSELRRPVARSLVEDSLRRDG